MLRYLILLFGIALHTQYKLVSSQPYLEVSGPAVVVSDLYDALNEPDLSREAFDLAYTGYINLLEQSKITRPGLLTIIDYSKSSNIERFFTIDLYSSKIIYKTLVAHGRNSGSEFASIFSDQPESYQSSIGFFLTGELYCGKHGASLRLDGIEPGINGNARDRAIVIHGASYVSKSFILQHGRLGRSFGCPALPNEICEGVIKNLSNGSCVFIYYPDKNYVVLSPVLNSSFD